MLMIGEAREKIPGFKKLVMSGPGFLDNENVGNHHPTARKLEIGENYVV